MEDLKLIFRGIREESFPENLLVALYLIKNNIYYPLGKVYIVGNEVKSFSEKANITEVVEKAFRLWVISGKFWKVPQIRDCLKAMLAWAREQYIEGDSPNALLFPIKFLEVRKDSADFVFEEKGE